MLFFVCVQRPQTGESSMSTSLLYHGFGIRGYQYAKTVYVEGELVLDMTQDSKTCRCSAGGS
jgi:hypothetical protein